MEELNMRDKKASEGPGSEQCGGLQLLLLGSGHRPDPQPGSVSDVGKLPTLCGPPCSLAVKTQTAFQSLSSIY